MSSPSSRPRPAAVPRPPLRPGDGTRGARRSEDGVQGAGEVRGAGGAARAGRDAGASAGRRRLGRLVDSRGLTAAAAVLVLVAVTAVAAATDLPDDVGGHRVFFVCFVVACAGVALTAHQADLRAVVVMPPLVFAVGVGAVSTARAGSKDGSLLARAAMALVQPLVFGAPALLTGTFVAMVLVGCRAVIARQRA